MRTFIDTSAFYALLDRDDANHARAAECWPRLLSPEDLLLTSNYVVVETTALVQRRLGNRATASFLADILPVVQVRFISEREHEAAQAAFLLADRRKRSLVDCSSFEIMRRLGLTRAFTFDRHFAQLGFELTVSPGRG
jgi:predicted nucleic acid-binding protein